MVSRPQSARALQTKAVGKYLLGCAIVACNLWVLIATEVDPKPAVTLPGDHFVFDVAAAAWESIPLKVRVPMSWEGDASSVLNDFKVVACTQLQ